MTRRRTQLTVLLGLCLLLALGVRAAGGAAAGTSATQPNFVVVITDDQTIHQFSRRTMPYTRRVLGDHGTTFNDFMVTSPLCCPSRASFLTGQYAHNHRAWHSFPNLSHPDSQLGSWLQAAGYRTAMVGKYLNGYGVTTHPETQPATGWNQWRMLLPPLTYYDYDVSVNGRRVHKGHSPPAYQTNYLARQTTGLIHRWGSAGDPFFVWLAPHAPHGEAGHSGGPCSGGAVPAPGDQNKFGHVDLPDSPSVNEDDMKDKPPFMQSLPRLSHDDLGKIAHQRQCRLESLRGVDRAMKRIVGSLRDEDALDNTVIVLTSDNGLFEGEHRLPGGKRLPYLEAIQVPFAARFPQGALGGKAPSAIDLPTANIDLAPTFLDLAGAEPCAAGHCRVMDGRSLLPLLTGHPEAWPVSRGLLNEMHACRYDALVTEAEVDVVYETVPPHLPQAGGCRDSSQAERYDLEADPFELHNLAASPADIPQPQMDRLDALARCRGIEGRDPTPPDGRSYCE